MILHRHTYAYVRACVWRERMKEAYNCAITSHRLLLFLFWNTFGLLFSLNNFSCFCFLFFCFRISFILFLIVRLEESKNLFDELILAEHLQLVCICAIVRIVQRDWLTTDWCCCWCFLFQVVRISGQTNETKNSLKHQQQNYRTAV